MSEVDLHGLPPLPPVRPMTDEDWDRLHAHVFGTIAGYERRRRTRLLLVAAAVLVVALVAIAATWQLTRPSEGSQSYVGAFCASEASSGADLAQPPTDIANPVAACAEAWRQGAVVVGTTTAPDLLPCARDTTGGFAVTVFPASAGATCAALGHDDLSAEQAADIARFTQAQDALVTFNDEAGGACKPFEQSRDVARDALSDAGLSGWEVVRDGSFDAAPDCLGSWIFDYQQRLLYLYAHS